MPFALGAATSDQKMQEASSHEQEATRENLPPTHSVAEFDWLKVIALLSLIFVHSDLYSTNPEIIYPIQCFLLSCFFFVSGFLAFDSFRRRGASIRTFLKSKILSLYVPFAAATIFYFVLQTTIGSMPADGLQLLSHVTMLNIFDDLNSACNWGFLWFIPYLLVFMLILCLLEKYVANAKFQLFAVLFVWLSTILAWVYGTPLKLGLLFTQYFLVFMIGFWINKLKIYERAMSFKTVFIMAPLVALFSLDFSDLFSFNNTTEALEHLLYSNGRSIVLCLSAVLLVLFILRSLRVPRVRLVELAATTSVFIYLIEPFSSYMISNYVFQQPTIYFAAGGQFYLYQITRIVVLLVLLPLMVKAVKNTPKKLTSAIEYRPQPSATPGNPPKFE